MTSILKSTKFIHSLVRLNRLTRLIRIGNRNLLLRESRVFNFNEIRFRSAVSLAKNTLKENYDSELEKELIQLSKDVENQHVYIEDVKEIFEAIKQKGEISYPQIILLLKCCSEVTFISSSSERVKLAEEIWLTATQLGSKFQISQYNALLNVFLENNHKFSPSEFLALIQQEGIKPNLLTYRRILKAYSQQGNIAGANSVLEKMKALNYPLNEEDFNSLILGYCETGELDKATEVLKVMQESDIDPSLKTYVYLCCGYAKHGETEKLKSLLEELPGKDVEITNSLLLEILYALAVHNQTEHIDMILEMINSETDTSKTGNKIIQKLLHNKLDSIALRVFEKLEGKDQSPLNVMGCVKHILRHFVTYRDPSEVLDLCAEVEKKGWTKTGLNYILRQAFLRKDDRYIVDLLNSMKARQMEVRFHYFWPAIIKASEKGNEQMLEVLKVLPPKTLKVCLDTNHRIILPNYKFGEDWRQDYDSLLKAGLRRSVLGRHLFSRLLSEEKFEVAEELASDIHVGSPVRCMREVTNGLQNHPSEYKRFINMVYYLAHDHSKPWENEYEEELGEETTEENSTAFFDLFVETLVKSLKDEEVLLNVLQDMSEKKMGITSKIALTVADTFENEKLVEIVHKLASPEVHFEYDKRLLQKKGNTSTRQFSSQHSTHSPSALEELNEETLVKEMESALTLSECVRPLLWLAKRDRCPEAIKLAEKLRLRKDLHSGSERKQEYLLFVCELYSKGHPDLGRAALDLGVDIGIIQPNDTLKVVRFLFQRNNPTTAVELYCEQMERTKQVVGTVEMLYRAVCAEDEDIMRKLTTTLCAYMPKNQCLVQLALAMVRDGQLQKATKLLTTSKQKIGRRSFYDFCTRNYSRLTSGELQNLLNFVKDRENFDRVPLYRLLVMKCADEENIESSKNLWPLIEEDDISNYDFLQHMRDFVTSPTLKMLKHIGKLFASMKIWLSDGALKVSLRWEADAACPVLERAAKLLRKMRMAHTEEMKTLLTNAPK